MAPGFCDVMPVLAGVEGRFALVPIAVIIIAGIGIGSIIIIVVMIIPGSCKGGMGPASKLRFYLNDWTKVEG